MSSLSLADAIHPEGTPWILPRLDPGKEADPQVWDAGLKGT